jgi:hypothetical protein
MAGSNKAVAGLGGGYKGDIEEARKDPRQIT